MKLIPNWRRAWRMFSVQAMAAVAVLQTAWPQIPDDIKASWPPHLVHWVTVALVVAGVVGRVVAQPKANP